MTKRDKKHVTRSELRQFGLGLGLLACLGGALLVWKGSPAGVALVLLGPLLAVAFWCHCPGTRSFYLHWLQVAGFVNRGVSLVILSLIFVLVVCPIALLSRTFGQRFVERKFREDSLSYWQCRHWPRGKSDYEKQS